VDGAAALGAADQCTPSALRSARSTSTSGTTSIEARAAASRMRIP
jgi:hypothetical protein